MKEQSAAVEITCPKCHSPLRSQERNGVVIDRCTGCGGVFLDRGELERLVELEGQFYGREPGRREDYEAEHGRREEYDDERYEQGRYGRRRRRGFLGDILDFG